MTKLPFVLQMDPLDPAFSGTPQELAAEIARRSRIVGPSGFYGIVVSDSEPTSNQGLWLKPTNDGNLAPYTYNSETSRYVPMDLSESVTGLSAAIVTLQGLLAAGRVIFSPTAPPEASRAKVIWVRTLDEVAQGAYAWDGDKWARLPGPPSAIGTAGSAVALTGDAADLDILVETDLVGRVYHFTTHTTVGAAATFQYGTFPARPFVRPDGVSAILSGEILGGTVFLAELTPDLKWRVLTPLTPLTFPALTKRHVVSDLAFANQNLPLPSGFGAPDIVLVRAINTTAANGFIPGDWINADTIWVDDSSDGGAYRHVTWSVSGNNIVIGVGVESGETPFYIVKNPASGDGGCRQPFIAGNWKMSVTAFA